VTLDDCFQLGYITKPHGLKGEVNIFIDSDLPKNYSKLESVFVNLHEELVPFFIQSIRIHGQKATIKFESIDSQEQASELKGQTLHLPVTLLPPLSGKKFYYHEITGFIVIDQHQKEIGRIKEVLSYPNQDLLVVQNGGNEVLIPVNNEIVQKIDRKNKTIDVLLPEGLLDIYL